MSYIGRSPAYGLFEKQTVTGNNTTTSFTLNYPVSNAGSLLTIKNGLILNPGVDYTVNYNTLIFASAPGVSDVVYVIFQGRQTIVPYSVGKQVIKDTFVGNNVTTIFNTSTGVIIPAALMVFVDNSFKLINVDYTLSGSQVTFTVAPATSAVVSLINLGTESGTIQTVVDGSLAYAKFNSSIAGSVAQWSIISTATLAVNGTWYMVDTTSGAVTLTLPATPSAGNMFQIIDVASKFDVHNCTVARNGNKIMGVSSDMTISTVNTGICLVWSNSTFGWRLTHV